MVSGEGRSDIGGGNSGQAISTGDDFYKGPMTVLLERVLNRHLPYWIKQLPNSEPLNFAYVSHGYLKRQGKDSKLRFPSKDVAKGHLGEYKQAAELAKLSITQECQLAVYFIDCDGKNEDKNEQSILRQNRVNAIKKGFTKGKALGVAMVPKPTSEAWLICHCQTTPYNNCGQWETRLSGNDNCPDEQSAKKVLKGFTNMAYNDPRMVDIAHDVIVDRLNMPSFNQFRNDLKTVIRDVCGEVEE
ncbi:MAG: hypothetical protein ACI8WB_005638 [Phenylobacterium sp.]|jgi:hypothetical protein